MANSRRTRTSTANLERNRKQRCVDRTVCARTKQQHHQHFAGLLNIKRFFFFKNSAPQIYQRFYIMSSQVRYVYVEYNNAQTLYRAENNTFILNSYHHHHKGL